MTCQKSIGAFIIVWLFKSPVYSKFHECSRTMNFQKLASPNDDDRD